MFSDFLDLVNHFAVLPFCQGNQCFKRAHLGSWVNRDFSTPCGPEKAEERVAEETPDGPGPASQSDGRGSAKGRDGWADVIPVVVGTDHQDLSSGAGFHVVPCSVRVESWSRLRKRNVRRNPE